MLVKNTPCYVYDIESTKNVFTCTVKDTETNQFRVYEVSERRNQILEMCDMFINDDAYFVGYNNLHYDNPIINYCIEYFNNTHYNSDSITRSIFNLSQIIVNSEDTSQWRRWKYATEFKTFDLLTMLFSSQLRVGLKAMQITMHYKNVQEFDIDWDKELDISEIDKLISYNINDVDSTSVLLDKCKDRIDIRLSVEQDYGFECLSKDDVNLGMEILKHEYLRKTKLRWDQIKDLRSPAPLIALNEVISQLVHFDNPILQNVLADMRKSIVSPGRDGYKNEFVFGGMKVAVGVGGIHGDCGTCIIKPNEDEVLMEPDVASLYPSLIIEHKFYPPHLGEAFLETYSDIRTRRLVYKHTKQKLKDTTFKFCLNGLSGNLQNEHSWCYSPFTVLQIRINGQLFLLMLAEKLLELGCSLKQINTDGIVVITPKNKLDEYNKIVKEWEKKTLLTIETENFKSLYQLKINDYFGEELDGSIKKKGFFLTETTAGKGLTPKIIPEAIITYFTKGIPVEETIRNCTDIKKFLQSEKTGRQWQVEYNDQLQQRNNRFYVSKSGYYLWKYKNDSKGIKQYNNMLKGYGVRLLNKFYTPEELQVMYNEGKTFNDIYDVNYDYYIIAAKKVIEELKPRQLTLF